MNVGGERNVALAEAIARWAHTGYFDKNGYDYIEHPAAVAAYVRADDPYDYDGQIVAWLHDVVEDTEVGFDDLRAFFPFYIIEALDAITFRSHNRNETRDEYYARVRENPIALRVKLKDIQHNTSAKRMNKLDDETRARLIEKYRHALEVLNA